MSTNTLYILILLVVYVLLFIFGLSLQVRRFHDLGHSGWWALLGLIPFINFGVAVYLIFVKGDAGQNAYGAPNVGQSFWRSMFAPGSLAAQPAAVVPASADASTAPPFIPSAPVNPVPPTPLPQPPQQPPMQ
jgi:hypothetical protein